MPRTLLPIMLVIAFVSEARAQTPAVPAATQSAAAAVASTAAPDSALAVGNLFRQRRTGGWIWTAIGGISTIRTAVASSHPDVGGNAGGKVLGVVALGGIPVGVGISKLARFSYAREEEILKNYQEGKPLPRYIRRRLKPKHF
jgi:hypothetical protein